ncbi:Chaperonin GroEL (HSP60 family) [Halopelagius inordinatus]|uniref:Chaperonin GroEL (HSP60 family) n=1 Tax=Halopelagius inordinatus TaxID=553467 RepID=A0A1I2P2G8_9EURY|nr:thermosome subunit alpha [Halopelagius inordinatus]SFG07651.1 Chaperonin GroEL (HSP60 family) [Halopelagius inordinatus]
MHGPDSIADITRQTDDAVSRNIAAGVALSEVLRTTLGPKGRDKMLVGDGTVVLTNDGASIVDRIDVESPAANVVAGVARSQGGEVGDGSTSAIVLAGALLKEAESLLEEGFHPTTVVTGYRTASRRARDTLADVASVADPEDRSVLRDVAAATITGRWDEERSTFLADLSARAYLAVRGDDGPRLGNVTVHGVPGAATTDSELLDGLVVDTDRSSTSLSDVPEPAPRRVTDARVAIVDDQLTVREPDATSGYTFEDAEDLRRAQEFETDEYRRYERALTTRGVDVLFCQKSVDERLRARLAREGILVFERTRQDEVRKLERATGASAVMRLEDLSAESVGRADAVVRTELAGTEFVTVREASSSQVSLLLRGGTDHVVDETERIVVDAVSLLATFEDRPRLVPGGGATEIALARDLRSYAPTVAGREQFAVEAFADALERIPFTLAQNAGMDPIDALLELRRRHDGGDGGVGVAADDGTIDDVTARGVSEPLRLKDRVVANATDAAGFLLRIDEIIQTNKSPSSHGSEEGHDHDHSHAGGGLRSDPHGYPWAIGH